MKTQPQAYEKALQVDSLINEHIAEHLDKWKNPSDYFRFLSKEECINWFAYIRTIQTGLTILKESIDSRLDVLKVEKT